MIKLLFSIFGYAIYPILIFDFLNPQNQYAAMIDNYYLLYSIILSVSLSFVLISTVSFALFKDYAMKGITKENVDKYSKALSKIGFKAILSNILSSAFGIFAFIALSYHYLGSIMIATSLLSWYLINDVKNTLKDTIERKKLQNETNA